MGKITIQDYTTKKPISMIGEQAGICWGADISDNAKNYKRGIECLQSNHGRTFEYPDVYMIIEGCSARLMREWYTHCIGATRLQASTRYIDYKDFSYIIPNSILTTKDAQLEYETTMECISVGMKNLEKMGIPREDIGMLLPLGMITKVVDKRNLRSLLTMAEQRKCTRAYWEYRKLFSDIEKALSEYSEEWKYLVDNYFRCKCETYGYCTEKYSCGKYPKKEI